VLENWTFGRKVFAGFLASALVLALVGGVGYNSTHSLIQNEYWVSHTHQVRRELADLIKLLTDAETGQRGYVITGSDDYLAPYRAARADIDDTFATLRHDTADNRDQQQRLDRMRPLVDRKLAELERTITLRRAQGFEATRDVILGGEGIETMDEIRAIAREMDDEEVRLLTRRHGDAESSAALTKSVILWGSILGFAAVMAIAWFLSSTLSRQIGSAVGHMHSSSAELQAAANQQASGAKEQATAMNEITTTINELLATSRQIAESAQRVAQISSQTATAARGGDGTVVIGQESMVAIRRQVDVIVGHMLDLGKKSQQVGTVLDIVAELAEQTNILAINATIEAAGAGDAGRRFAVVADEIRKLADRVGGSTKEIRALVEDVRSAVNTTVMTTEIGSKAVDAGARHFADVAASFKQISTLVSATSEAAREIELSTRQQTTAVEQVTVGTTQITQAARETEVSTTQTLQTASQLATLSQSLLKIVQAGPQPTLTATS
jgi:methyl-accepting chemotaxis protein